MKITSPAGLFSKQRPPGTRQCALFHFAQGLENLLPGFAQDDSFPHLKSRHPLAIFMGLLLPHIVIALQQHAASLDHLGELQVHLRSQELRDRKTCQKIYRKLEFFLSPIE